MRDELGQLMPQFAVAAGDGAKALHLLVGATGVHDVALRAKRHAPHTFQQPDAEHCRPRPELAKRQGRDTLIFAYHELDILPIQLSFGVRDQLVRDAVDARKAAVRPRVELGQLLVVALRHVRADLPAMLGNEKIRVEQPRPRRRHVDAASARVE